MLDLIGGGICTHRLMLFKLALLLLIMTAGAPLLNA